MTRDAAWRRAMQQLSGSIVLAASLAACMSLPDAPAPRSTTHVSVRDANGPLAPVAAQQLIERAASNVDAGWLRELAATEQAVSGESLWAGNHVELLIDGPATYASMFEAMRAATDHINVETYILADDEVGKELSTVLVERARAGVAVSVIYDGVGSLGGSAEFFDAMRAGGVRLIEFHPVDPTENPQVWKIAHRDHRKLTVVDGRIAFVGGINFSSTYSSSSFSRPAQRDQLTTGWRDTHLRIEGPVVASFQQLFLETWREQGGEPAASARYFPEIRWAGTELVRVVASNGGDGEEFTVYESYLNAIANARNRIWITQAYFVPNEEFIGALEGAAQRGVDVRVLLPGFSDSRVVLCASRALYDRLLAAGVRLYEYTGAVLHAKTAVIDGVWSTIGSTNLDQRSFAGNDEANAVIVGRDFARQMEQLYETDLASAEPVTTKTRRDQGLLAGIAQFFCKRVSGLL